MKGNSFLLRNIIIIFVFFIISFNSYADKDNPQFSDFTVRVSQGPFIKKLKLNGEQQQYSKYWRQHAQQELGKPVNFAGHYRLYTIYGGHGKECEQDNWVCGWIIDKLTGDVVSGLPIDALTGTNIYGAVGSNGTPVGFPFDMTAYKDSTMIYIAAQSVPDISKKDVFPICKSTIYNFKNNNFIFLGGNKDGCKVDE